MISPSLRHCSVAISRVIRVISVGTRELHIVFPEKIHHFDTENTCISRVILEYVSAGSLHSAELINLSLGQLARTKSSETRVC